MAGGPPPCCCSASNVLHRSGTGQGEGREACNTQQEKASRFVDVGSKRAHHEHGRVSRRESRERFCPAMLMYHISKEISRAKTVSFWGLRQDFAAPGLLTEAGTNGKLWAEMLNLPKECGQDEEKFGGIAMTPENKKKYEEKKAIALNQKLQKMIF